MGNEIGEIERRMQRTASLFRATLRLWSCPSASSLTVKLATMYSSGSPRTGQIVERIEVNFLDKLQRVRTQIKPGTMSQAVFPPGVKIPDALRLMVGNWSLSSAKDGELVIQNFDRQQ
jgi:hypothetical protein